MSNGGLRSSPGRGRRLQTNQGPYVWTGCGDLPPSMAEVGGLEQANVSNVVKEQRWAFRVTISGGIRLFGIPKGTEWPSGVLLEGGFQSIGRGTMLLFLSQQAVQWNTASLRYVVRGCVGIRAGGYLVLWKATRGMLARPQMINIM